MKHPIDKMNKKYTGGKSNESGCRFEKYAIFYILIEYDYDIITFHIHQDLEIIKGCNSYIFEMKNSKEKTNRIISDILENDFLKNREFCENYMSDNNFLTFFPVLSQSKNTDLNIIQLLENTIENLWINDLNILEKIKIIYLGDEDNTIKLINKTEIGLLHKFNKAIFLRNLIPAFDNFKINCQKWLDELNFCSEDRFNHSNWIKFLSSNSISCQKGNISIFSKKNFIKQILNYKSKAFTNDNQKSIISKILEEYSFLIDWIILYIDIQKGKSNEFIKNIEKNEKVTMREICDVLLSMINNNWEEQNE